MESEPGRYQRGTRVRREVLGDAHVDGAVDRTTALDEAFQTYITGAAWADVWGGRGLDRAPGSLITIALLAALGHGDELELHLRAARRTGASEQAIAEALMHAAVYAGFPPANQAFGVLKRIAAEDAATSVDADEAAVEGRSAGPSGGRSV